MIRKLVSQAALVAAVAVSSPAFAASYYFDSSTSGGDLSPFNSLDLNPGDKVYLKGSFDGTLSLDSGDAGSKTNPVTITSWGNSPATINAGNGFGLKASNVGGVSVSNLNIFGSGPSSRGADGNYTNTVDGIRFYSDSAKQDFIRINNVKVAGFGENGINILGGNGTAGFNDVKITNSSVYNNQRAGLNINGDFDNANRSAHTNVVIDGVKAYDNTGRATSKNEGHSGNGIVIGQVNGGVIQNSTAWGNGTADASKQGGSVGIWAWDSNQVTIQHNESFKNGTAGEHDGGGFDLDGGVTNSVMQYNYSHDNAGAGYLLAQFKNAKKFEGNLVANNISDDDGRKNGYGAIHAFGAIDDTTVRDNIVYLTPAEEGLANTRDESPAAIKLRGSQDKDIDFADNVLILRTDGDKDSLQPTLFANMAGADGYTVGDNEHIALTGDQSMAIESLLADLGGDLSSGKAIALSADSFEAFLSGEKTVDPVKPPVVVDVSDEVKEIVKPSTPTVIAPPVVDIGSSGNSVPEPSSLGLLGVGAIGLLRRRRHA